MSNIQRLFDMAIEKVGGSFKCSVLLQKRVRELVRGEPPLISVPKDREKDYIYIALQEILQDKISLVDIEVIKRQAVISEQKKVSKEKKPKK
jgi:DNA-directed RNA polymerase subunit K/omega